MKILSTLRILAASAAIMLAAAGSSAQGFDLKGLLGGSKDKDSDKQGSSIGNILGNIIDNVTADRDVQPNQLIGDWTYGSPAVDFESDNALQSIGGSAASATIESKLEPYYSKAGITQMKMTVDTACNFSMQLKVGSLTGKIEKPQGNGQEKNLTFKFQAFKKITIGSISAHATLSGNTLSLTFDVSGLIKILKTVSSVANNSSFNTMVKLLESYDGLYAGFKLERQK